MTEHDVIDAPAVTTVQTASPAPATQSLVRVADTGKLALTPTDVRQQVNLIQQVMGEVMHSGEHYGTIPGCGNKPTLLKAGAEKLAMLFRLAPSFAITRTDLAHGHREYEIVCTVTHAATGIVYGQGVGCASTMESKHRYRGSKRACPKCGNAGSLIKTKGGRNPGGYWCVPDKGGCGANFNPGDPEIEGQQTGRTENPDIADTYNTVLKMAKKRALVDAILTATAASDIFTQDIEDLEPEAVPAAPAKPAAKPAARPQQAEPVDDLRRPQPVDPPVNDDDPIDLAGTLQQLVEQAAVPPSTVQAWLNKAGVKGLSDMSVSALHACIVWARRRLAEQQAQQPAA